MEEYVVRKMKERLLAVDGAVAIPTGHHCVDLETRECTCWDFMCVPLSLSIPFSL